MGRSLRSLLAVGQIEGVGRTPMGELLVRVMRAVESTLQHALERRGSGHTPGVAIGAHRSLCPPGPRRGNRVPGSGRDRDGAAPALPLTLAARFVTASIRVFAEPDRSLDNRVGDVIQRPVRHLSPFAHQDVRLLKLTIGLDGHHPCGLVNLDAVTGIGAVAHAASLGPSSSVRKGQRFQRIEQGFPSRRLPLHVATGRMHFAEIGQVERVGPPKTRVLRRPSKHRASSALPGAHFRTAVAVTSLRFTLSGATIDRRGSLA